MVNGDLLRLSAIDGKAVFSMVASKACIKKAMAAIQGSPAMLRADFIIVRPDYWGKREHPLYIEIEQLAANFYLLITPDMPATLPDCHLPE